MRSEQCHLEARARVSARDSPTWGANTYSDARYPRYWRRTSRCGLGRIDRIPKVHASIPRPKTPLRIDPKGLRRAECARVRVYGASVEVPKFQFVGRDGAVKSKLGAITHTCPASEALRGRVG